MRERRALLTILGILLIILAVLIYLYLTLVRPVQLSQRAEITPGMKHIFTIYGYGSKPEEHFNRPHGVAVDKKGNFYVTDTNNHRILVFDSRGRFLRKIGKAGAGEGEIRYPLGLAIAPNGDIYVASRMLSKIVVYNQEGKFSREIKEANPLAPFVSNRELYVVTAGQLVFFDLEGNLIKRWGRQGSFVGEYDFPGGIFVDIKGNIYISDSNNGRLQAFDKKGSLLWVTKSKSLFGLPEAIVGDNKGRLFVVDAFDMKIKVFRVQDAQKIIELGDSGQDDGQFYYPSGLAYAGNGIFYIADKFNHRVQKVRITPPRLRK
ncbi:MAG TPA: 6-bladed beta-propeller [Candidatus Subteraquimicrobiales bacterium]